MTQRYEELGGQPAQYTEDGQAFLDALTRQARANFLPTATAGSALKRAISLGWTARQLATECSRDLGTASNAGAIITTRLQHCATHPPAVSGFVKFHQPKPWCGQCSDPDTRWRTDTDKAVRCGCWTNPKEAA